MTLLKNYPDARKSDISLIPPVLLPYVAIMFGAFAASAVASYNALALRRPGLMVKSLLIGAASWIAFPLVVVAASKAGMQTAVAIVFGRLLHFTLGGLLFFLHRPHHRGHEFLNGNTLPILQSYLAAILLSFWMPSRAVLWLLGGPLVR